MKSFHQFDNQIRNRVIRIDEPREFFRFIDVNYPNKNEIIGKADFDLRTPVVFIRLTPNELSSFDSVPNVKPHEVLVRYATNSSLSGGIEPIAKISVKTRMVYFNKPEAGEEDRLDFERRGTKLEWLSALEGTELANTIRKYSKELDDEYLKRNA